jgi:hypothetical protein
MLRRIAALENTIAQSQTPLRTTMASVQIYESVAPLLDGQSLDARAAVIDEHIIFRSGHIIGEGGSITFGDTLVLLTPSGAPSFPIVTGGLQLADADLRNYDALA